MIINCCCGQTSCCATVETIAYVNGTRVGDYNDPPGDPIEPYEAPVNPDGSPVGGGLGVLLRGPWPCGEATDPADSRTVGVRAGSFDGNVLNPSGPLNLTVCKCGFKAVTARATWHGTRGFLTGCETCAIESSRYLKTEREARLVDDSGTSVQELSARKVLTIDGDTGCSTETLTFSSVTDGVADAVDWDDSSNPGVMSARGRLECLLSVGPACDGHWTVPPLNTAGGTTAANAYKNGWNLSRDVIIEWNTLKDGGSVTGLPYDPTGCTVGSLTANTSDEPGDTSGVGTLDFECDTLAYSISWSYELSEANPFADVLDSVIGALTEWPLTNSTFYPWRADGYLSINPLMEKEVCNQCNAGSWMGQPFIGGVPDKVFSWDHLNYIYSETPPSSGMFNWEQTGWGAWNTEAPIPTTASRWPDKIFASGSAKDWVFGGWSHQWLAYNQHTGEVAAQKHAEIKVALPGVNYFRPCLGDRWLQDETKNVCIRTVVDDSDPDNVELEMDADAGVLDGQTVVVYGGSYQGVWDATAVGTAITLSNKRTNVPAEFIQDAADNRESTLGYCLGLVGVQRFPGAWPIGGRTAVVAATAAAPVQITLADDTHLITGDSLALAGIGILADGNYTVTRIDSRTFTLNGTDGTGGGFISGGWASSPGAPSHTWFNTTPQGKYIVVKWADDPCGTGGLGDAPGRLATPVVTEHQWESGACPAVVLSFDDADSITPGEVHSCGYDLTPTTDGARRHAVAVQMMPDPFWQAPSKSCKTFTDFIEDPDNEPGDCVTKPAGTMLKPCLHPPYVEAVKTAPAGAPALPSGCSLYPETPGEPVNVGHTNGTVRSFTPPWVWAAQCLGRSCA